MRSTAALLEAGLLASTTALAVLWLALPDGTGVGQVISVAAAVGWAAVFFWGQSAIFILLRRGTLEKVKAWKGALLLLGLMLVYWLVVTFFDAGALQDADRADWWMDQTWVWHVAGAGSLERAQAAGWWLLRWALAGALLPIGIEGAARGLRAGWLRAGVRPLRRWVYWATVLVVATVGTGVTHALLPPRTGLPVVMEVLLAVLAASVVFVVDVGGLCCVLALTASYLRDAERAAGAGRSLATGDRVPAAGEGEWLLHGQDARG